MNRRGSVARWTTVACVSLAIAGNVPTAAASRVARLGRSNVVVGTGSASATVALPEQVTISNPILGPRHFSIHSKARFAGFVLVPRDGDGSFAYIGGRLPMTGKDAYFFAPANPTETFEAEYALAAGRYELYVVASDPSASVRIELRLDALRGRARVSAEDRAPFEIRFPEVSAGAGGQTHSYSATGRFPTRAGVLFGGTWHAIEPHAETVWETCFFEGPPPEEYRASATGCYAQTLAGRDGITGAQIQTNAHRTPDRFVNFTPAGRVYVDGENWLPGRFSIASTVTSAGVPEDVAALAFWLGF
ncbi:MAG TPA: hypothetical protein VHI97_03960 [Actinomycetota bacterium]|nr:hypothetical protein [Actinomycetota bacterium]